MGDDAPSILAEPTHTGCLMLGMATGKNSEISVQDFGIDNVTIADGLAVGRASGFVGAFMRPFMDGCYSLDDSRMYEMLALMADSEHIFLEPSALAGMYGPLLESRFPAFKEYLEREGLEAARAAGTQLIWLTGGSMVPEEEMRKYYESGRALLG